MNPIEIYRHRSHIMICAIIRRQPVGLAELQRKGDQCRGILHESRMCVKKSNYANSDVTD